MRVRPLLESDGPGAASTTGAGNTNTCNIDPLLESECDGVIDAKDAPVSLDHEADLVCPVQIAVALNVDEEDELTIWIKGKARHPVGVASFACVAMCGSHSHQTLAGEVEIDEMVPAPVATVAP